MANDNELSGAIVREYFVKNGGKVKRDDLFDHFRSLLDKFNDQGSSKNRFGDIVNSIASLQNVEGEKYFVLKKTKTTPVLIRRQARQVNHRKDKGVSLPASMRNFRFSAAEDAFGNLAIPDSKIRPSAATRARAGFKSESSAKEAGLRRNNSDTSVTENGQANDSGVDTAVSSLQSDSPRGSRQSSFSKGSEYDRLSQNSGDTRIFNEDDHYEHDVPSHVLTSLEKSWMMSTMAGNKSEIVCQLEEDPNIVSFKDFMVGYTALHWAAKQGNEDIVRLLVGAGAIVNVKSNGGYTPLHLATMHGKVNIINLLIDEYHANVHIRDHSGKEAKDVLTKNSTEQIKQKLADPRAAVDSSNIGGFNKYLESKDSPKLKPKLKAGASFRFLKKQKKVRRSERPVIEHWDSTKQERLQSTMGSDEKELYKMQRSNSGSLFPTSFYPAKRHSQLEQGEEKPADIVDSGEGLGPTSEKQNQRERLHSRSYPENEFRDLARISESDLHESRGDHRSPSESSAVDGNVLGSEVKYTSEAGVVFEGDSMKRRSLSDNNLNKHASIQDELATRLTKNGSGDRPPSVFTEDSSSFRKTLNQSEDNEDVLTLKIDSSPLADDVVTVPSRSAEVNTQPDGESMVNGNMPAFDKAEKSTTEAQDRAVLVSNAESKAKEPFLTYKDEYSTTLSFPNEHVQQKAETKENPEKETQERQQQQEREEEEPLVYHDDTVIPKFNNNYKQVSEILSTKGQNETTQEEPTSPVRPPRRKDKKRTESQGDDYEQNIYDFDQGNDHELNSTYLDSKQDVVLASHLTDKNKGLNIDYDKNTKVNALRTVRDDTNANYKGNELYLERTIQSSNSLRDSHLQADVEQFDKKIDHAKRKPEDVVNHHGGFDQVSSRGNQDYSRRNSNGFAAQRARSEENMFDQYSKINTRRKSEGFFNKSTSREEFLKPAPEHVRRKSEGFTGQRRSENLAEQRKPEGFTDQRSKKDFTERRKSEGFTDHRKSEDFINQQRSEDFENQRRSQSFADKRKSENFTDQRKSEDFQNQQRSQSFAEKREYKDFKNQRRPEEFTHQKEMSLDHPRRRTMHNPPRTNQTESRHVLPEVLLDPSRRRASSGYPKGSQEELGPVRDPRDGSSTQVEQRVLPPYRPPPPGLLRDPAPEMAQGSRRPPTRPNYMPPPPPNTNDPFPNRKSLDFQDFMLDPRHPLPKGDSPTARPNELLYHPSEDVSKSTRSPSVPSPIVSPTAPPRKHRGSVSRSPESIDYPPPELSPTAPPRKHRGSVHRSSGSSRPSYPPPSLPSDEPPPRPNPQMSADHRPGREISLDHPKRRSRNQDDTTVISASGFNPSEYNNFQPQSSTYRQSDPNDFQSQSNNYRQSEPNNFQAQSSNYRQSEPNDFQPQSSNYRQPDPNDFQPQSSNYRQSDPNDFQSQSSNYRQSEPNDFQPQSSNYRQSDPNDFQPQSSNYRQSDPNNFQPQSSNYRQSDPNDFQSQSSNYRQSDPNNFQPQSSNYRQSDPNNVQPQSSNYRQSDPNDFQSQSSNYRQSDPNDFQPQSSNYRQSEPNDFLPQSSNYRQSDPNDYHSQSSNYRQLNPYDFQSQSSNYRQSDPNDFQPQSSNYRHSELNKHNSSEDNNFRSQSSNYGQSDPNEFYSSDSSLRYPPESSRYNPSQYSSNFEPTVARDLLPGNESPSSRRRSAVDTTTRDQSPPEEVVLARSITTSEPERYPAYPSAFRYDEREPDYYRKPPESSREGYNIDTRNGTFAQPVGIRYENEFESVLVPKYDGFTETTISPPEKNLSVEQESEFIVAKQMPSHQGVTEARPVTRGSREDLDSLPGSLREDMKNKWISSSSDGSNESSENRNKYRMTSLI